MAAGLGFKTFTTGEVLTAADTNGYLMQGILVFASSAARATAITSPQEGQYSYLKDTNALEYYDGAAWVGAPVGDITSVTAGTGISGGGASGAVTITNSMATEITAAGDIIVGTGSSTFDNLPIGTTGQVLTADTTVSPYKVKWATPSSGTPAFVGASVYNSTNVTINHNTYTQIPFNSELFDTDNFHSTTTNNSRLTIPSGKDGKYQFTFAILADPYGVAAKNVTRLYKNGSGGKITVFDSNASDDSSFFMQGIESAVAGDYFEIYCNQNTGSSRSASGGTNYCWFSIQYLGA